MKKILLFFIIIITSNVSNAETIDWQSTRNQIMANAYEAKLSLVDIDISKTQIMNARSEYFPKIYLYAYNEYVGWVLTQILTEKTKNKIKKIAISFS